MRAIRTKLAFLILLLVAAACSPASGANTSGADKAPLASASGIVPGGTLVRAMTSEPAQIDPQGAPNSGLSLVIPYLYDTLVVRDVKNQLVPSLAETWQVAPDGKAITFKLRAGVTFHDGTALNAEAVKYTFQRFKETGKASPIYDGVQQIAGIDVVEDLTVRFTFKQPTANFWSTISMPYAGILSPASAKKLAESGEKGIIAGTGPFILESWLPGQALTFKRNPAYNWGPALTENRGAPYLDKMVFKVIPDAQTQLAALQAGEVDAIFVNEPDHRAKLQSDPKVHLEEAVLNSLIYLGYNNKRAPFDDPRVRQALSYAVNKDQIVKLALGGVGLVANAPLPPSLPGYDDSLKAYALGYDPAKARALLKEAGFVDSGKGWEKGGQPLKGVLLTSNRAPNDSIAALLQSQLKEVGVPVEIQQLDSKAVMQATTDGKFDLLLWRYDWNDPDALNIYLGSDRIGSTNRVAYSNAAVDKLLVQGAQEQDPARRNLLYIDAQKQILQDAPWQPLYVPLDVLALSKRIQGLQVGYMGRLLVNDAHLANSQ